MTAISGTTVALHRVPSQLAAIDSNRNDQLSVAEVDAFIRSSNASPAASAAVGAAMSSLVAERRAGEKTERVSIALLGVGFGGAALGGFVVGSLAPVWVPVAAAVGWTVVGLFALLALIALVMLIVNGVQAGNAERQQEQALEQALITASQNPVVTAPPVSTLGALAPPR